MSWFTKKPNETLVVKTPYLDVRNTPIGVNEYYDKWVRYEEEKLEYQRHRAIEDAMVYDTGFYLEEREVMRVSSPAKVNPNEAFKRRKKV